MEEKSQLPAIKLRFFKKLHAGETVPLNLPNMLR